MQHPDAKPCEHRGIPLHCPICHTDKFSERQYALRTIEDEMFKQPWAVDELKAYVCGCCGHVLWFA